MVLDANLINKCSNLKHLEHYNNPTPQLPCWELESSDSEDHRLKECIGHERWREEQISKNDEIIKLQCKLISIEELKVHSSLAVF